MASPEFLDAPPDSTELTDYDRTHMKAYMRVLDADTEGADWREAVAVIFGLDPLAEPERAQRVHDNHLARARWMSEHGYRHLLREGRD
ncbi:MAG: DUF2285 domain-containing protein [Devosia sp.]|uniref:DNA -binding domain-containing protein n=1 Tax=Devosia sp. TaxID=1871048 RepID=UPI001A5370D7|nr:DUF2285 domain-containing protein [Devosia sp.]MBL8598937.1 DUF2285 domain-containing protein [Devosia sp.]